MAERKMKDGEEQAQTPPVEEDLEELRKALEESTKKSEEYLSLLQRLQADFQNFRKRVEQEREEQTRNIKANIILKILPIIDDFDRAVKSIPEKTRQEEWVQGVALIDRKLHSVLESEGLKKIEAENKPFNPWEHEAVMQKESSEEKAGEVVDVFREGYKLDDKVIRPAQVAVGKGS